MKLWYLDLNQINPDHLAKLASIVEEAIDINGASTSHGDCGLSPILKNIRCPKLELMDVTLSTRDAELLVLALEQRVKWLCLSFFVTLDLDKLLLYSGKGLCREILWRGASYKFGSESQESKLKAFARRQ